MLASGRIPDAPVPAVAAFLDLRRFGRLPLELLDCDAKIANEIRWLADVVPTSGDVL